MPAECLIADSLLDRRAAWLRTYRFGVRIAEQGTVVSVGDGIAWIGGLPSAGMDDVLDFDLNDLRGIGSQRKAMPASP